jgi:phosphatidate cytidylyltransferase
MKDLTSRFITGMLLSAVCLTTYLASPILVSVLLGCTLLYILMFEWSQFRAWYLTPLYPIFPFILLIVLNMYSVGMQRLDLIWIILITISHDTGAYFIGHLKGMHKLCPTISPGKTWEGLIGGLMCSGIIAAAIYRYAPLSPLTLISVPTFMSIVTALNFSAVAGDLFESYLKRRAGIKDSGTLLPGHGGVLDRLDSLLFSLSAWVIIRSLFLH